MTEAAAAVVSRKRRVPREAEKEMVAIRRCIAALEQIETTEARKRVIDYVAQRAVHEFYRSSDQLKEAAVPAFTSGYPERMSRY